MYFTVAVIYGSPGGRANYDEGCAEAACAVEAGGEVAVGARGCGVAGMPA